MYESTIIVTHNIDDIERLFIPEDKTLNRSTYTVKNDGKRLIFKILADDATALKTAFNTITKVLLVWEKTKGITDKK